MYYAADVIAYLKASSLNGPPVTSSGILEHQFTQSVSVCGTEHSWAKSFWIGRNVPYMQYLLGSIFHIENANEHSVCREGTAL